MLAASAATLLLAACGGGSSSPSETLNTLPAGFVEVAKSTHTAVSPSTGATTAAQDLLTAGLGKTGLGLAAAPAFADPLNPTPAELRRNAIHANYRAILDPSANGGYGSLYGPNINLSGGDTLGEGLIPGVEYIARLDDGTGRKNVTVAVQIPASFDAANPCVVAGPSSGSRGVYGSIGSASEWGLKRGCAVALTDSGKGMGLYDPMDDSVNKIDGVRSTRSAAGALSHFAASITDAARAAFNTAFPNRLGLKHAHSQQNPEKDWGNDTLASVKYALFALNKEYAPLAQDGVSRIARFNAGNTLVIAGSVSNGGAAVLRAAELDTSGLIDGVVAAEPSAQPRTTVGYGVQQGGVAASKYGLSLIDYFTFENIYQPCAAQAPAAVMSESSIFNYMTLTSMNTRAANRCAALAAKGLVTGTTLAEQATDAMQKLRNYGFMPEHDLMHNAHYGLGNGPIIAMMYPNALGRFSMTDNLCGASAAAVNATGDVVAVSAAAKAGSFASGNGTVNGSPASVVYNDSVGGAKAWQFAVSASSGKADFGLDVALCQRALVTGTDAATGAALTATSVPTKAQSDAVKAGIAEVQLDGNLRGKPTLIVAGRSDALVPVNHSARAYTAYNRMTEGSASKLSYVEVTNAQHFDTFLPFSGFDTRYVPLHYYFVHAMNAMYANLKSGTALPPSQVVRTTPRGGLPGAAPAITKSHLPLMATAPSAANQIGFAGTSVNVPD
ncbi:hydrogenase [Rhodoferax sp. AJA081-3]|uniref:3-hydroxybutyrate oligomer hydrolase family protein n=1 Tax=Rhodoferax sp. AJA081-3 TaxID=2752316 RepID=UPI001AE0CABC|nr:3-hydroxybutyrate oligomer hydrolase family protein [Rhodoferax sp. AJA081-3]QTN30733.1 hydrogenase [Rhodoferax sp. AJA081-3]